MDGYMAIIVAQPGECCAQEVVNVSHEVGVDMLGHFFFKFSFFFKVCGVEDEVIHVHAHVYFSRGDGIGGRGVSRVAAGVVGPSFTTPEYRHGSCSDGARPIF